MAYFDIFNGDADGICALIQLRQAFPRKAQLITGCKRDIELLQRVPGGAGDQLSVLDIALPKNRPALMDLLDKQAEIFYVDHHAPGEIPHHTGFSPIINTDANICTSLLINQYVRQCWIGWAVTGAFGDNLIDSAISAAQPLGLTDRQLVQLQQLGIYINYNAYGESLADLHMGPDHLYQLLTGYASPLDFIADNPGVFNLLQSAYQEDMALTQTIKPEYQTGRIAVYILPDQKWARRVNGVWGNQLANQYPDRAHAVISHNQRGGYQISVRAPLSNRTGADAVCAGFAEGGGRQAAAGINHLERHRLDELIQALELAYG